MALPLRRNQSQDGKLPSKKFEALSLSLMDSLYSNALHLTKNRLDAEDLLQETYLKAWRFYHQFEAGTNFRAWMFRILMTTFINSYRKKKREPVRVDFETISQFYPDENTSVANKPRVSPARKNYDELFDDTITTALDNLPEHFRIPILLCDVNDLKYKEIADILDSPIGTIMSRLSRGRKLLAETLKPYATENGYILDDA